MSMIEGLPEKLKMLREGQGLSRRMVCEQIGISQSILADYESGHRTPSLKIFMKLCATYHCSPNILLGKEENQLVIDTSKLTDQQIKFLNIIIDFINTI